jgi:two-component system, NarL family, nitrate/nitrite response regulator NarL
MTLMASGPKRRPGNVDPALLEKARALSPRQSQVLKLIAGGHSNKQIASMLGISERTVETHREQLMDKLDLKGTAALTRFAMFVGLLEPGS